MREWVMMPHTWVWMWEKPCTTPDTTCPTLYEEGVGFLTSHRFYYMCKSLWDGAYGLSSLSEKSRKFNRLQMLLQRQYFLLSYLKTLSVDPAGVWTYGLPLSRPGRRLSHWANRAAAIFLNLLVRTSFKNICYPFFSINHLLFIGKNSLERKSRFHKIVTRRPQFPL